MTKKKKYKTEDDEVSRLQKENRELKALNRSLMKRIKKVDKQYVPENEEETPPSEDVIIHYNKCPECNTFMVKVKLAGRSFERCPECQYRTKAVLFFT